MKFKEGDYILAEESEEGLLLLKDVRATAADWRWVLLLLKG